MDHISYLRLGKVVAVVFACGVADVKKGSFEAGCVALGKSNTEAQDGLLRRLLTVGEALGNFRAAVENMLLAGARRAGEGKRREKGENEQTGCDHVVLERWIG